VSQGCVSTLFLDKDSTMRGRPGWRGGCALRIPIAVAALLAAHAFAACEVPAGRLVSAQARVEVRAAGKDEWIAVTPPHELCEGDIVTVRSPGRAAVVLYDDTLVRLDQNSTLHLLRAGRAADAEVGLAAGVIHVITPVRKRFGVNTPFVNALVEGTEFTVSSTPDRAQIVVASGTVRARNAGGELSLRGGEAADARGAERPAGISVLPLDALRWAIHYPQVVWHGEQALAAMAPATRVAVTSAQTEMAAGRPAQALAVLPDATADEDAVRVGTLRAALLLALGRVDAARDQGLDRSRDAAVAALEAIIHVARNEQDEALAAADEAVATDAGSAAAYLALSYARQARGEPEQALEAARDATRVAEENPFAWARRGELELSLAQTAQGRASVEHALALAPALPRAQALLGFAHLLEGRTRDALARFDVVIAADPDEPLAHFGRGLARIRSQEFAEGRRDVEIAVLLDPANAELRSYLGRLYVEEDRAAHAGEEFDLARRLDPASPTPWYFDAFRRLRDNDPLGALADGRRAVELNDRRVVIRSPLLLDTDRAARSASLGPAQAAVGFTQSLRADALTALADDPIGPAGHRRLADAYAALPRFESARVSELLQTQLREPIGRLPVAPQFLAPDLPVVDAPRALAPEEAAELFERGPSQFAATALAGSQATRGGSVLAARSSERAQVSLGHFDYRRDGLGAGRDIDLSGTRVGLQFAATPATMLLAEVGTSDRRGGDVVEQLLAGAGAMPLRLDHRVRRDLARVSLRHAPGVEREFIVSAAAQDAEERSIDRLAGDIVFPFERADFDLRTRVDARDIGALYAMRGEDYGLTLGGAAYHQQRRTRPTLGLCCLFGPEPLVTPLGPETRSTTRHDSLFAYLDVRPHPRARVHVGVAHDALDAERPLSVAHTSGKLGASLLVGPATTLRVAALEGVKGPKYRDQTLEPTQFAGFNQVFDDLDGTRWRRKGVGLDHRFADGGGAGLEWTRRTLSVPGLGCGPTDCRADWDERLHRAYVEWPLGRRVALSAAWHFERLHLDGGPADSPSLPFHVRTELVPLGLWARVAPRVAAQLEAQHVKQRAAIADGTGGVESRSESAWLGNARVSYVHPGRRFLLSLAVYNLFDRRFSFQNTDFSGNPRVPLFHPERTVLLQANLRF